MRKVYFLLPIFCILATCAYAHKTPIRGGRTGIHSFFLNGVPGNGSANNNNIEADAIFACSPPTGLNVGSITTTSASVSFTSAATSFIVEYGPTGFTPGVGAGAGTNGTVVTGTSSPIALSGLTNGTSYQVYVRSDCGVDGFSANTGPFSFNTSCAVATLPYFENFDGVTSPAIPLCLTVQNVNGGNTWETVFTDDNVSSPNIMRIAWEPDQVTPADDWFFTKGLNLTAGISYRLKFSYRNSDADIYIEKLEVKYGTGANAASMTAGTLYTNTHIDFKTWLETGIDFTPPSTGVYYIGFHGFSDANQAYLAIDNINVDVTPVCSVPTGVTINNITPVSATVNFSSPGTDFIIEYGLSGFLPGSGSNAGPLGTAIAVNSSQLPYTITGLATLDTFDVYIRQVCSAGAFYGANTAAATFITPLPNDEAPGAITVAVDAACSGNGYTNSGATQSASEKFASCTGTAGYHSVWYKFTAPAGGAVKISTDFPGAGLGDSRIAVFAATNVNDYNTFTTIGCDNDNGVTASGKSVVYLADLVPNIVYYIQVDGVNASTPQGLFCLEVSSLNSSMIAGTVACGISKGVTAMNANYTGWISLVDNSGKLIANVKQTAGTATSITADVNVHTGSVRQDPASLQYYLDRNYRISAPGATSADIQFFFKNSELNSLHTADTAVTLSNLGVTRQTGSVCNGDFSAASGTNSYLVQTGRGTSNDVNWVNVTTPGFSNFYLHTSKAPVTVKTFLQGAYSAALSRHKNITTAWANALNGGALNQPYSAAPFNYTGTEHVSPGFFVVSSSPTAILDWVLVELRDASNVLIKQRAAFILLNGQVVDLDGTSSVSFRGVPSGNYFIRIRHRNHLGIRTAITLGVDGALGSNNSPPLYDFSTAQSQAIQIGTITTNAAMAQNGAVFMMWGGNANADDFVRMTSSLIPPMPSDPANILGLILGGNPNATFTGYSNGDINMDGNTRVTSLLIPNIPSDAAFILGTALGGIPNGTRREHK